MATARASTGQMPVVSPPLPVSKQMTGSSVGPLQQTGQFDPAPAGVPDPNPSADSCQAPPRGGVCTESGSGIQPEQHTYHQHEAHDRVDS